MAQYLLVDDREGQVVAELASAEQAARLLSRIQSSAQGNPPLSVVRVDRSSVVELRPLSPPVKLG
jgi:hypothetical protein